MIEGMCRWRANQSPPRQSNWTILDNALKEQSIIGWEYFLEGLVSKSWAECHRAHCSIQGRNILPTRWTKRIISRVISVSKQIWNTRNSVAHSTQGKLHQHYCSLLQRAVIHEHTLGPVPLRITFTGSFPTIPQLQKMNTVSQFSWLKSIESARRKHQQQEGILPASKEYQPARKEMRSWFENVRNYHHSINQQQLQLAASDNDEE